MTVWRNFRWATIGFNAAMIVDDLGTGHFWHALGSVICIAFLAMSLDADRRADVMERTDG